MDRPALALRSRRGLGFTLVEVLVALMIMAVLLAVAVLPVLWLRERYQSQVPWLAMNSFRTRADTLAALARYPLAVRGLPVSA